MTARSGLLTENVFREMTSAMEPAGRGELDPVVQVGKAGITPALVQQTLVQLGTHELHQGSRRQRSAARSQRHRRGAREGDARDPRAGDRPHVPPLQGARAREGGKAKKPKIELPKEKPAKAPSSK